jgi:hypothetical protein
MDLSSTLSVMLVAADLAAFVIVVVMTTAVVGALLGLFVWAAVEDGRALGGELPASGPAREVPAGHTGRSKLAHSQPTGGSGRSYSRVGK